MLQSRRWALLPSSGDVPLVGRVVVLDAALHVLELVQHGEHVDELAQRQQVRLRDKVLPALGVAQSPHLAAETVDGRSLGERERKRRKEGEKGSGSCTLVGRTPWRSGWKLPGST